MVRIQPRIPFQEEYHLNPLNAIIGRNQSILSFMRYNHNLIEKYLEIFYFIINRDIIIGYISFGYQKIDITISDLLRPSYKEVI